VFTNVYDIQKTARTLSITLKLKFLKTYASYFLHSSQGTFYLQVTFEVAGYASYISGFRICLHQIDGREIKYRVYSEIIGQLSQI